MPRMRRIQEAGYVHHVISRGNDQQCLFRSNEDFEQYLTFLWEGIRDYPVDIYNFVLMINHVHILIEPLMDGALSKLMKKITWQYANYYNKKYHHSGHVFFGRYRDFLVQEERYFLNCLRYIDRNPMTAKLIRDPKDYLWSGHGLLAYGEASRINLKLHSLYLAFGSNVEERQFAYRAFVWNPNVEELDLLNRKGTILGDDKFYQVSDTMVSDTE